MEILTSKLQILELNIINSKIQCLKREISHTLKKIYFFQIEKSELTLKKIHNNLKISQSLGKLSRHINNNSSSHVHYLNKNIDMCFRILKIKVFTGFNNNLLYKLNTLQKLIYYKKDVMYTKIRGTVVYRENKERLGRKIGIILKELSEKIMRDSEKCIEMTIVNNKEIGTPNNKEVSTPNNKLTNEEISSEGVCTVNVYEQSSFDFNIGEATCTVNKFENQNAQDTNSKIKIVHEVKEGKCSVDNFVNLNDKKWKDFCCNVNKKEDINNENIDNWNNENIENWNNETCTVHKLGDIENWKNETCTVHKLGDIDNRNVENIENWNNETCTVHKLGDIENWNNETCTVKKEGSLNGISTSYTKIESTLANLNRIILRRLYIILKELFLDIVKLRILLKLQKVEYYLKGRLKSNYKNGSKISYILQKGDLDSDKRFLHMIDDTLKDIEKYKDPIVVRMGIQFMLAKRYVEDIIYLKNE